MEKEITRFVGARIKEYRKNKKLSQKELGELIGVKHNTISSYESGNNEPVHSVLYKIANALDVSINDFFPHAKEVEKHHFEKNLYTYYPTSISAGSPNTVEGITEKETISIPDDLMGKHAGNNQIYVTRVNGESMNNVMPDNSIIAVKPVNLSDLKNGDIVVYKYNQEYAVKRFYKNEDTLIFRPDSTENYFTDNVINVNDADDLMIKGKVVMHSVIHD